MNETTSGVAWRLDSPMAIVKIVQKLARTLKELDKAGSEIDRRKVLLKLRRASKELKDLNLQESIDQDLQTLEGRIADLLRLRRETFHRTCTELELTSYPINGSDRVKYLTVGYNGEHVELRLGDLRVERAEVVDGRSLAELCRDRLKALEDGCHDQIVDQLRSALAFALADPTGGSRPRTYQNEGWYPIKDLVPYVRAVRSMGKGKTKHAGDNYTLPQLSYDLAWLKQNCYEQNLDFPFELQTPSQSQSKEAVPIPDVSNARAPLKLYRLIRERRR